MATIASTSSVPLLVVDASVDVKWAILAVGYEEDGMDDDRLASAASTLPRIKRPGFPPVTPKEIERRRVLFDRMIARRERIGPIGIRFEDLIHELRGGDERFDK